MDPHDPPRHRAFESPFREDPPAPSPDGRAQDRSRYAGRAMLAAFVLLAVIVALILLF